MTHDELQHDLALTRRACGEIVAEQLGLGSYGGGAWVDVAAMKPSWTQPNPTAYEVKISRADFLRDAQSGKYQKYLPFFRRLYFACPRGMLAKDEIPEGTGLIVRGDNGWSVVKAPRPLKPDPAKWPVLLQALLLKHYPGPWVRVPDTRTERINRASDSAAAEHLRDRFRGIALSEQVRKALQDAQRAQDQVDRARDELRHALGDVQQDDERSLLVLAREVLNRAPKDPPALPFTEYDMRTLEGIVRRMREGIEQAKGQAA